jgi:hypothetical protein
MKDRHNLSMRLAEYLPELAEELKRCLNGAAEPVLAGQIDNVAIVDRCRCGDSFCGSIRTARKPNGAYGDGHRTVLLEPANGMLILDVVHDRIVYIEVLYRPDVKERLDLLFV